MKHKDADAIRENREFEEKISIRELNPDAAKPEPAPPTEVKGPEPLKPLILPHHSTSKEPPAVAKKKKGKEVVEPAVPVAPVAPRRKQPDMEDDEGFVGRRPAVDPFRVGEKQVFDVSYFGISAGDLTLEVRPFVEVNGRKSYHFACTAKTTSIFAKFYAVDDWAESYVDFENVIPYSYSVHVKESKQLRETRNLFDWENLKATWWEKKVTPDWGVEEKKQEWKFEPWSQDIFSGPFYLRNFTLKVGKKLAYRVSHEGKNFLVTGEVVRRERLKTAVGEFDTYVIKPKIQLDGAFQAVGDIFFWLTADDRKFIVRIESKIKIGTLVASIKSITPGP